MTRPNADQAIRRAIGGDPAAIAWIVDQAATTDLPILLTMAALLGPDGSALERALQLAVEPRDRQVVAIARACLRGDRDLVDALARDHLVDRPDSYVVAWIAASGGPDRSA